METLRSRLGLLPQGSARVKNAVLASVDDGVATLRLYDPIDSWGGEWGLSANEFKDVLDGLDDGTREIRLHINSPGGEVFEGLAILNQLRQHPARVVAIVDGLAASIASVIAAGADELVMCPSTSVMIHDSWGLCIGNAADMRKLASTLDHVSDNIAAVYQGKAGGTAADWRDLMLAETWYSPEEAVEAGLADRVAIGVTPEPAIEPAARFDLSGFKYAGRAAAPSPAPARPAPSGPVPAAAAAATETRERWLRRDRQAAALSLPR